jgi:uncharacterized protein (TIGR03118 family)
MPWTHARLRRSLLAAFLVAGLAAAIPAAAAGSTAYRQTNLVSDIPGLARLTDPNLVNPWGLAAGATTPLWASNNGTDTATIYPGAAHGMPISMAPLVVNVAGHEPTGQVFNPTEDFPVSVGGHALPARFIFDSQDGTVSAWPFTDPPQTTARVVARVDGAAFTGLAMATVEGRGPLLYLADFPNHRIVVLNRLFGRTPLFGHFADPMLPAGWGPFNIQAIGDHLLVSFAKLNGEDEQPGPGLGRVDVFSTRGVLLKRLIVGGALNAPWGLVQAPRSGFGPFSGDLLVGNFGDGRINAYNLATGHWEGVLRHPNGAPIVNEGLWGLRFGNGVTGTHTTLLFSAGIDDESHGLLGRIDPAS